MDKPKLFKKEDFDKLFELGKKISTYIVEFGVAGSVLWVLYQLLILGNLWHIQYFSRTQVINDTIVMGSIIFVVYQSYLYGLRFYEKFFYHKEEFKYFIYASIICFLVMWIWFLLAYLFHNVLPVVLTLVVLMLTGFIYSFFLAMYLHDKQQQHWLKSKSFWDLSKKFNEILIVLIFIMIFSYHEWNYQNLEILINEEIHSVKYMNDMYIITEDGVFDRDGNKFFRKSISDE